MKSPDTSLRYRISQMLAHTDLLRSRVPVLRKAYLRGFRRSQLEAAHRLRDKERIEVAFFLTVPGMWKCDYLMQAMMANPRYHPYVVVYPYSQYKGFSHEEVEATLRRTVRFVEDKGYECVVPYDSRRRRWQDVKKTLNPDVVVFSDPYKDCLPRYFIHHFRDRLTCYVPYSLTILRLYRENYGIMSINLMGLFCLETPMHRELALKYMPNGAVNAVVTGYPGTEVFLDPDYPPHDPWKPQPVKKKRVIWAPHHSIDDDISISTFLLYCDDMLEVARRYSDRVQFAFKPHQLLKFKLQRLWGAERTERYYNQWAELDNGQLEEASYVDLFLTSDAMVHDSASFTTEYLYTRKPVMYLVRNSNQHDVLTPFGHLVFDAHYHGRVLADIEHFLDDTVLGGDDPKEGERKEVYDNYLGLVDGMRPSQRIIKELENLINS
ncbi:MAG: CDP-glycerol glycerophosphotransferase family protein [Bacteroidales bacterium]|nr:CDP-glycerol glycerophosphotransferase family protein [Bacteroidales bacterium]